MSAPNSLLLAILKSTLGKAVSITALEEAVGYPSGRLRSGLEVLERDRLVCLEGEEVTMDDDKRVRIAMRAIASGSDPEVVCKALDWREFESLSVRALASAGYETRTHFRFTSSGRRREIDVLATSQPRILCIDCKRWKRAWQRAATRRFVEAQIERVEALSRELPKLAARVGVSGWGEAQLLPVLLTLSDTPYRVCNRAPVVSVLRLRSFLWDLPEYAEGLLSRRVTLREESARRSQA